MATPSGGHGTENHALVCGPEPVQLGRQHVQCSPAGRAPSARFTRNAHLAAQLHRLGSADQNVFVRAPRKSC
eukprot:1444337-Alexandrium_andersonii.AAC.1